jgi:hypothetical protein
VRPSNGQDDGGGAVRHKRAGQTMGRSYEVVQGCWLLDLDHCFGVEFETHLSGVEDRHKS